jgi:hypothetical protein
MAAKGKSGRGPGRPRNERHHEDYLVVADQRPEDPMKAVAWAGQILTVAMQKIAGDPNMSERLRRQELRATAKVMAGLVPVERLLAAETAVRRAADDMVKPTKDPEMTDVANKPARSLRITED